MTLTSEKLQQAADLVVASDLDLWLTFDRETADGGDPVLPLILSGGLTWNSALIVTGAGERIAIVGNYDAEPLEKSGDWTRVVPYVQSMRECFLEELERIIPQGKEPRIGVNYSLDDPKADGLSHGMFLTLIDLLKGTRFEGSLVSAEPVVSALRAKKTPEELRRIRHAIDVTERIFERVPDWARPGVSEAEVYRAIQQVIDGSGHGYGWDRTGNPIVNSGPNSMIGHGIASESIKISAGHIFHIDLGVIVDEYSSDIQRCWYVPHESERVVPDDVIRASEAVSGAIQAGFETLRIGVEGWRVDEAARKYLVAAGYEEYMHALGHQVGRVAHDGGALLGPRWERYGQSPYMRVEAGHVYTLELGVTVEGRGYLGFEEMVHLTESGPEWLTKPQRELPLLISAAEAIRV